MLKHRILQRCLLTLAVSAAPGLSLFASGVFASEQQPNVPLSRATGLVPLKPVPAIERSGNRRSAVAQAQYQTASETPGNGPSTTVNQELNRLFQESGQQMPSMRAQDLPYATTPRTDLIRRKSEAPQAPKQPGVLGRFFNRFRSKSQPEMNTSLEAGSPPPIRMPDGSILPNGRTGSFSQNSAGNPGAQQNQARNQYRPVPPAANQYPGDQFGANGQQQGARQQGQQFPVQQPAAAGVAHTQSQNGVRQPAGGAAAAAAQRPQARAASVSQPVAKSADDDFIDPFTDRGTADEAGMLLDLDSLIDDVPADMASRTIEQEPRLPAPELQQDRRPSDDQVTDDSFATARNVPAGDSDDGEPQPAVQGNPFTGVRLDSRDARSAVGGSATASDFSEPFPSGGHDEKTSGAEDSDSDEFDREDPASDEFAEDRFAADEFAADSVASQNPFMNSASSNTPLPPATDTDPQSDDDPIADKSADADEFSEPTRSIALPPVSGSKQPSAAPASTSRPEPKPEARRIAIRNTERSGDGTAGNPLLVAPTQKTVNAELLKQRQQTERREAQRVRLARRGHLTGFKGFCPVALRDQRELVDASETLTAMYALKTYYFSSPEAVARFQAEPSRYAAAVGGNDAVLLVNEGEEHEGSLDYALWYRDRLYLFTSRETMKQFNSDPGAFAYQH
ncbi:MAG: hypothetical protein R3C19_00320 [Planctomycetaceae bacterium]